MVTTQVQKVRDLHSVFWFNIVLCAFKGLCLESKWPLDSYFYFIHKEQPYDFSLV